MTAKKRFGNRVFGNSVSRLVRELTGLLTKLLDSPLISFEDKPSKYFPTEGGVYCIVEKGPGRHVCMYVGQGRNLRRRIWLNHYLGPRKMSTLKRKLIAKGICRDEKSVKNYLQSRCHVQCLSEPDSRRRSALEYFAIALLKPRHND